MATPPGTLERSKPPYLEIEISPISAVEVPQVTSLAISLDLDGEVCELEEEFDGLVDQVADDIENAIEKGITKLSRVKRSVTQLPVSLRYLHVKFLQGKLSAINKAETINELFSILGSYWDFMNCGLLVHLVKRFGSMETQQRMGRYLERLKEFRMRTTVREFTDKWTGDIPSNLAEFVLEMGEEWMDRSLEAVEELRTRFSRQCSFEDYSLPIKKGSHNSVILCFAFQRSFPMSAEILQPTRQFLQEQGVLRVFFKGVCLLDLRPPQVGTGRNLSLLHSHGLYKGISSPPPPPPKKMWILRKLGILDFIKPLHYYITGCFQHGGWM